MKIINMFKAVALLALLTVSGVSHALMITVSDGVTSVSVADDALGDSDGTPGNMTVIGDFYSNPSCIPTPSCLIKTWHYSVTGTSASSNLFANLFESSIDTTSTGTGGTLTITVVDTYTGLSNVGGGGLATSNITPSALVGTILFTSDLNSGATIVHSDTVTSVSVSAGGTGFTVTDPLTIRQVAVITHGGAGTTSFDAKTHVNVPEPISLVILGIGLIGLGLTSRKRQ